MIDAEDVFVGAKFLFRGKTSPKGMYGSLYNKVVTVVNSEITNNCIYMLKCDEDGSLVFDIECMFLEYIDSTRERVNMKISRLIDKIAELNSVLNAMGQAGLDDIDIETERMLRVNYRRSTFQV